MQEGETEAIYSTVCTYNKGDIVEGWRYHAVKNEGFVKASDKPAVREELIYMYMFL